MCQTNQAGNRILACHIADLKHGATYRTPDGKTLLMTDLDCDEDGVSMVVDIETGQMQKVSNSIRLGTDRNGRLYASRYLNQTPTPNAVADAILYDGADKGL